MKDHPILLLAVVLGQQPRQTDSEFALQIGVPGPSTLASTSQTVLSAAAFLQDSPELC